MGATRRFVTLIALSPIILLVLVVAVKVMGLLVVAGYLLACCLGGMLLMRWPVNNLRYSAIPAAVMGIVTSLLPPYACGYEPSLHDTFVLAVIFFAAADLVFRAKTYVVRVSGVLSLFCGVAVALHLQAGLCHADYPGEFDLLERWFRGGVWLATLAAMLIGWLCAWSGTHAFGLKASAGE